MFPHHFGLLAPLPTQSDYPQTLPWCSAFAELIAPENKVVTLLHEDEVSSQGNRFLWIAVHALFPGRKHRLVPLRRLPLPLPWVEPQILVVPPEQTLDGGLGKEPENPSH